MNKMIILWVIALMITACDGRKIQVDETLKTDSIPAFDSLPENDYVKREFIKSEIIDPAFDKELIFGVWGTSLDAPACDFEIDKDRYLICDYDGDGERIYLITGDSIFLKNPTLIFKGKILKVNKDSLIIHWQENKEPEVLLRWETTN